MQDNSFLIEKTKNTFNKFFKEELYGTLRDEENLILSRGSWNDRSVHLPEFFETCVRITLKNNWVGYSHSLGHAHVISILKKFVNYNAGLPEYGADQISMTLGNVFTVGIVFQQLSKKYPHASVLTFKPFYPPILKSIIISILFTLFRLLGLKIKFLYPYRNQ